MNQYIEFSYETVQGFTVLVEGRTNGSEVKFIAYNVNGSVVPRSQLLDLDIRNIEDEILLMSEPELEYYDLDYRDER